MDELTNIIVASIASFILGMVIHSGLGHSKRELMQKLHDCGALLWRKIREKFK